MISGQWSLWEHQNDLSWTSPPPTNTIWWFSTLTAPHKDLELQLIYAIHGKNLLFWRSILRDVGLTCSLFLVMCTSSTSVVNGKNCIQEWTPKDTYRNEIGKRALEYKYAMESIWFNTIGRSSSVSSILTRLFISLGMSSLRSSVYSIMLKHHTLLEVVWFHRVHPTETWFSLFGP